MRRIFLGIFAMPTLAISVFLAAQSARPAAKTSSRADSAKSVSEGITALDRGDEGSARVFFKRAITLDPGNVAAHTYVGILSDHDGNFADAERHFALAVSRAPQSAEARNNHGAILLKLGHKGAAAAEFEASLRLNPNQPGALVNLAQLRFSAGTKAGWKAAQQLFQRAQRLSPDAETARALVVVALRLNEPQQASTEYSAYMAALSEAPPQITSGQARGELGAALLEIGLTKEAAQELTAAAAAEPQDATDVVLLARATRANKDMQGTLNVLAAAAARGVETAPIMAALAEAYADTGQVESAIPAMRRAIELDPKSEAYRFRYAMLLTDSHAPQAAVIRLQEAMPQFPNSSRLWFAMGVAKFEDNKYDLAIDAFSRALKIDPQMSAAEAYLGMINLDAGKATEAVEHYSRSLKIDERSPVAHYLAAEAYAKLAPPNDEQIQAHLRRALELDPGFKEAHLALGKFYLRGDYLAEAAHELQVAVEAEPKLAEAYYQLSRVYLKLKEPEKAQAAAATFEQLSTAEKEQSQNQRSDIVRRLANVRF
jgi:tetratricopeptide (TPR) repeat protein